MSFLLPNGGISGLSGIQGGSGESATPTINEFDLRGGSMLKKDLLTPVENGDEVGMWFDGKIQFKKTEDFAGPIFYSLDYGTVNNGEACALVGPDVDIPVNTAEPVLYVHVRVSGNEDNIVIFGNNTTKGGMLINPNQFTIYSNDGNFMFTEEGPPPGEGEKLIRVKFQGGATIIEWTLRDGTTTALQDFNFDQPLKINTIFARSTVSSLNDFGQDGGHAIKNIAVLANQSDQYEMETIGCLIDGNEHNIASIVDSGQGNMMLNCEGALSTINVDDWIQVVDSKIESYNNFFRVTDDPSVYLFHFALSGSTYTVDEANVGATWIHETESNVILLIDQDDDGVFVRSGNRHNLSEGDSVTLGSTTDYDDTFEVSGIKNLGTFYIDTPFVSKVTTGDWSKSVAPTDPITVTGCIADMLWSTGTFTGNSVSPSPATTGDYIFRWTNRATSAIGAMDARILYQGDDQTQSFDLFRLGDVGIDQFGDPGEDYNKTSLLWVAPVTFNRVSFNLLRATGWTCYCRLTLPQILYEQVHVLNCGITDGATYNINIQKINDTPNTHRIKFEASDDSDFDFAVELENLGSESIIRWRVSPVDNLMRIRVGNTEYVGGDVNYNYSNCQGFTGNFSLSATYAINRLTVFNTLDVVETYGQGMDDAIFSHIGAG